MKKLLLSLSILLVLILVVFLLWPVRFEHRDYVTALTFSPDDSVIASGAYDHAIRLWDVATGKQIIKITEGVRGTQGIAFIDGGKTIVAGGYGEDLTLWNVKTGARSLKLPDQDDFTPGCLAVSPRNGIVVAGSGTGSKRHLVVWDLATRRKKFEVTGEAEQMRQVSVSGDGAIIAAVGCDYKIRLFSAESGAEIPGYKPVSGESGAAVQLSPYGNIAAYGLNYLSGEFLPGPNHWEITRSRVIIFDLKEQKEISRIENIPSLDAMVFLPPDGRKLVVLSTVATVYDLNTGKEISNSFITSNDHPESYAVSHNGNIVATGDEEGFVRLWKITGGEILPVGDGFFSISTILIILGYGILFLAIGFFVRLVRPVLAFRISFTAFAASVIAIIILWFFPLLKSILYGLLSGSDILWLRVGAMIVLILACIIMTGWISVNMFFDIRYSKTTEKWLVILSAIALLLAVIPVLWAWYSFVGNHRHGLYLAKSLLLIPMITVIILYLRKLRAD